MSIKLRLAYAEYESGDPLFAWLNGRRLRHDDRSSAHRLISEFRKGVAAHGDLGTAVRLQDRKGENLLIQTTVGFSHASGTPQRVVVVFSGIDWSNTAWAGDMTAELASVFGEGDIRTDREPFAAVIKWATAELGRGRLKKKIDTIKNFSKRSRKAGGSPNGDGSREASG